MEKAYSAKPRFSYLSRPENTYMPLMAAFLYGLPILSPRDVLFRLDQPRFFVFDSNPRYVYHQHRVPGAMPLNPSIFTDLDLPTDKESSLLFYSAGPMCSAGTHAARRARSMGYPNVYVMTAGITGWIQAGCPVEKG
jgi:rhodanese-related sulfurtransferase